MTAAAVRLRRGSSRAEEPEWPVWVLVILLLAIGLLARTIVLSRTYTFTASGVSVKYPASWIALGTDAGELLAAGEPFEAGLSPARFSLLQMPGSSINTNAQSLGDLALLWSDRGSKDLLAYKVLSIEPVEVRGQEAVRVDFVYVAEPVLATPNSIPIVARGADILIRHGDSVAVARLLADADAFDGLGQTWDRILGSLELK